MRLSPEALSALAVSSGTLGQVVPWGIAKRQGVPPTRRLADSAFKGSLSNDQANGGYFATVEIGTPSQKLTLLLDTGSSDVWAPDSAADLCRADDNQGCPLGSFTPRDSSTFDKVGNGDFQISYQDNSNSTGDYFTDRFQLDAASLDNFTMGLGIHTTIPFGIVGVGYASNEAAVPTVQQSYPNLPQALRNAGLINTVAFSLWLNDLSSSSGNILFGGIDTGEYVGGLTKMPILPDKRRNTYDAFAVSLFSLEATSPSGSDVLTSAELPLEVVLDSGTTLTYLPEDMTRQAWDEVGATFDADAQEPLLPCSFANHEGYFSFVFAGPNGPRINVTMKELVLPLTTNGTGPKLASGPNRGQTACQFGIQSQPGPPYLLGDSFLRSAYVVYDLVNNEIAIAPTNFNSTESNVVAFASHGASIPSATPASNQGSSDSPPQPTRTGSLNASRGFQNQNDNAAAFRRPLSGPRLAVVGVTLAYQLMSSWSVDRRPWRAPLHE